MSLRRVVDDVRGREKTLTVYAPADAGVASAVGEYFASQNVAVEHAVSDPPVHAVLTDDGEFLTAVGPDALRALTRGRPRAVGEEAAYGPLLEHLDRATFTSYSRYQMLQASREIEDRAWRAGAGRLHAGFQRLSNVDAERDAYERLADSDLDVHVYGAPDVDLGDDVPFAVHETDHEDVRATWFVVFDGGDEMAQSSALIAEEQPDGSYYGFWTYDASLVGDVLDAVDAVGQPA
ncbi:MAG: DICT sensory domain-containing protein [Halobacterium sp.]